MVQFLAGMKAVQFEIGTVFQNYLQSITISELLPKFFGFHTLVRAIGEEIDIFPGYFCLATLIKMLQKNKMGVRLPGFMMALSSFPHAPIFQSFFVHLL